MEIEKTPLEGLLIVKPKVYPDERGSFQEIYNKKILERLNMDNLVQENESFSHKNVLRGLHFQRDLHVQGKLVRVVTGSVLDFSVDLRKDSETCGKCYGIILSAKDNIQLYVPEGFAHGFLSLEEGSTFVYKCTAKYTKESESGIVWNDPILDIRWGVKNPILSDKDAALPKFDKDKVYFS